MGVAFAASDLALFQDGSESGGNREFDGMNRIYRMGRADAEDSRTLNPVHPVNPV